MTVLIQKDNSKVKLLIESYRLEIHEWLHHIVSFCRETVIRLRPSNIPNWATS
jgi:hypothetical protein